MSKSTDRCPISRQYFQDRYGSHSRGYYTNSEDTKLTERRFNAVLACADTGKAKADPVSFYSTAERASKALGYFISLVTDFHFSLKDGKDAHRVMHSYDVAAEIRALAADMLTNAGLLRDDKCPTENLIKTAEKLNAAADRIDTARAIGEAAIRFREQPDQRFLKASTEAQNAAFHLGEYQAKQAVHDLKQGWTGGIHTEDQTDTIARLTDTVSRHYATAADLGEKHGFDIDALDAELADTNRRGFASELADYNRKAPYHSSREHPDHYLAADALFVARLVLFAAENGVFAPWNRELSDGDKAARLAQFKADLPIVEARSGRVIDATAASRKAGELTLTADLAEKHGGDAEWIAGLRTAAGMDRQLAADLLEEVTEIDRVAQEVADAARLAREEAETQAAEEADQFAEAA